MKYLDRNLLAPLIIVVIVVAGIGLWFNMSTPVNNTTNNTTNKTVIIINETSSNQSQNNTTTIITAERAKQLAQQYIGMGVYLGNTTLTTYKNVKVWNVTVYTTQGLYTDSIYIDASSGTRVQ